MSKLVLKENVGIETQNTIFTVIHSSGMTLPCSKSYIFSTSIKNQDEIQLRIMQGLSTKTSDQGMKNIGDYTLKDIPPGSAGVPQILVDFTILESGELRLTARDNRSGIAIKVLQDGPDIIRNMVDVNSIVDSPGSSDSGATPAKTKKYIVNRCEICGKDADGYNFCEFTVCESKWKVLGSDDSRQEIVELLDKHKIHLCRSCTVKERQIEIKKGLALGMKLVIASIALILGIWFFLLEVPASSMLLLLSIGLFLYSTAITCYGLLKLVLLNFAEKSGPPKKMIEEMNGLHLNLVAEGIADSQKILVDILGSSRLNTVKTELNQSDQQQSPTLNSVLDSFMKTIRTKKHEDKYLVPVFDTIPSHLRRYYKPLDYHFYTLLEIKNELLNEQFIHFAKMRFTIDEFRYLVDKTREFVRTVYEEDSDDEWKGKMDKKIDKVERELVLMASAREEKP